MLIWCPWVAHGVSSQGKPFLQVCLFMGISVSGPRHLIVWVQSRKLERGSHWSKMGEASTGQSFWNQRERVWLQSEYVRLICPCNLGCTCLISSVCPLPCSEARIPSLWMAGVIVPIGKEGRHMVVRWGHDLGIQGAQNKRQWFFPVGYKLSSKREPNYIVLIMAVVWLTLAHEGNKITHPVSLKNGLPS